VLAVVAANVAMSVNLRSLRDSNVLKLASGIPYGLLAALGWGVIYFLIVYPTRSIGPWLSAFLLEVGVTLSAGLHIILRGDKFEVKDVASRLVILDAILIAVGTLGFTVGVKYFNVGIVAALGNSVAAISVIGATIIHHERLTIKEKVLAAFMITGVLAMTL
jgi:drug/metabolite transporter (DMT)-like permease